MRKKYLGAASNVTKSNAGSPMNSADYNAGSRMAVEYP